MADFGFAQHLGAEATERGLKGSPLYMAPEILLRDRYDAKADLWSTGVILYEALHGRAPFSSPSLEELLVKIKEDRAVELPARAPPLSADCRDLINRCLVRCPKKRIDFPDFFDHPFLDLEHLPDQDSLLKATKLVTEAVLADKAKDNERAVELYQKALEYFTPILYYEQEGERKEALKKRVEGYSRRLHELRRPARRQEVGIRSQEEQELVALCSSSPKLLVGVEVCRAGVLYVAEGELSLGLEKLTQGLGEVVPLLQEEPRSRRRDLLAQEVRSWMERAERVKAALSVQEQVLQEAGAGQEADQGSCALM